MNDKLKTLNPAFADFVSVTAGIAPRVVGALGAAGSSPKTKIKKLPPESGPSRLTREDQTFLDAYHALTQIDLPLVTVDLMRTKRGDDHKWLGWAMKDIGMPVLKKPDLAKAINYGRKYLVGALVGRREVGAFLLALQVSNEDLKMVRGAYKNHARPPHAPLPAEFHAHAQASTRATLFIRALNGRLEAHSPPPAEHQTYLESKAQQRGPNPVVKL